MLVLYCMHILYSFAPAQWWSWAGGAWKQTYAYTTIILKAIEEPALHGKACMEKPLERGNQKCNQIFNVHMLINGAKANGLLCEMETISQLKIGCNLHHWGTTPKETSKVLISALSCWARVDFILKTAASYSRKGPFNNFYIYCIIQCKKHWVINSCATFVCIRHMLHMTNYDGK